MSSLLFDLDILYIPEELLVTGMILPSDGLGPSHHSRE